MVQTSNKNTRSKQNENSVGEAEFVHSTVAWNWYHSEPACFILFNLTWNKAVLLLSIWDSVSSLNFSQSWQYPSEVIILTLLKEQKQLTGESHCCWGRASLTQQEWGWKAPGNITEATQPPGQDKKRKTVASNSIRRAALDISQEAWQKLGEMKTAEHLHLNYEKKKKLNMWISQLIIYCLRLVNCTMKLLGMHICYIKGSMKESKIKEVMYILRDNHNPTKYTLKCKT